MTAVLETPAPTAAAALVRVKNRGYYKDPQTGERYTSVTTILDRNINKPLAHWAANTVAKCAMDNLPYLTRSSRAIPDRIDAYDWLRGAAERAKEDRAGIGSAVHALIEHRVLGTPVPPQIDDDEDMAPYLAHFEAFVRDWQVTFTASEMIVGNRSHLYAGTLDYLLRSPLIADALGVPAHLEIAGDTKTGGELDVKGVYPEAALQMSAYGHAEFAQLRDGSRVPMPPVAERGVVLHLRPEGYRLIEANVGDDVFAQFLAMRALDAAWTTDLSKRVIGRVVGRNNEGE